MIVRLDQIGYRFETARDTASAVVPQIVELQQTISQQLYAEYPELLANSSRNNAFEELLSGFDPKLAPASTLDEQSVYSRAQDWSTGRISGLEDYLRAPLPVSLRACYENIEHVSLIGTHPVLNPTSQEQSALPSPIRPIRSVLPDPLALVPLPDGVDYES